MPEPPQLDFDVFISYSSKDKAWVRGELLRRLKDAGLRVCLDTENFTPGAPILTEIERAIDSSHKTLLILTPNYLASEWTKLESLMLQTEDPANRALKMIPVYRADCEIPKRIRPFTPVYFTDPAENEISWRQLLTALGKPPESEPPKVPERDDWFLAHPYPMPPNFTGRVAERAMFTGWLDADVAHPLLSLRALGGFGKSALVWHWLTHDVPPAAWPRVVWWSFYEGDASFDHFLIETLNYLSEGKLKPDRLSVNEVRSLLRFLEKPGTLLVLDGFERALRAFGGLDAAYRGDEVAAGVPPAVEDSILPSGTVVDNDSAANARTPGPAGRMPGSTAGKDAYRCNDCDCISPLAENLLRGVATLPGIRSKVLLTTRLCPHVLEAKGGGLLQGCREEELRQMQPADAVEFFRAQGIRGTHTEIEAACEPYGYHPLSLRLLAGLVVGDFQQPGDIAAAKRLDVSGDLIQRQHHVLETAYNSLTPERQALLGRIACFRSPVKYDALMALAETNEPRSRGHESAPSSSAGNQRRLTSAATAELDADLRDLVARGLLHHDTKERRFDLHPIVRRYAYDRVAAPERAAAHTRLRDYFAAMHKPVRVARLEDLAPVIELYHHTVHAGQYDEAFTLFHDRINKVAYYQLGAHLLEIDLLRALFPDGDDRPARLGDESAEGGTLNELANSYSLSGQPHRAVATFELAVKASEKLGSKYNVAVALVNIADDQLKIGALQAAEANLRRSMAMCREIKNEGSEGTGLCELGRVLAYTSRWTDSIDALDVAEQIKNRSANIQAQGVILAYRALRGLLLLRSASPSGRPAPSSVLDSAHRALELADEKARTDRPNVRDYVRAHWLLGAAQRIAGQTDEAECHLHDALERCRRINLVAHEADILIDLARLRAATGAPDEAQRLAEEALLITERSGYVLQGADAHLELAKLARARNDKPTALAHAQEARRLATCDGPPDYTYKAAYDEAGALLAQLREG